MTREARPTTFNSPLETGVRSLAILVAAYPAAYDLERLVEMDYLVVHSGDADGPNSLHAPLPLRAGELLVRRALIEKGLLLMMSRNLVQRLPTNDGFAYLASDSAAPFLASLSTSYAMKLKERADWAIHRFADTSNAEIRQITHRLFKEWSSQFQVADRPRGGQ
jgi:hypothetical protein